MNTLIENAITIDVEEHFQVAAFKDAVETGSWPKQPSRVVANTEKVLAVFDDAAIKGTFFTLGWVAERYPELVRRIQDAGHEVACHGYSHQLIYEQSPKVFREETLRAKRVLEDAIGESVDGYRAASYSITRRSLWALDTLVEAGFRYDSSIFPVHHDNYGIPDSPRHPYQLQAPNGGHLIEFPITTSRVAGVKLPVAGGGYFRLFPYWLTRMGLKRVNEVERRPFVFYLHPWEVDPAQPRIEASRFSQFRHYNNLDKTEPRLRQLISDFRFTRMDRVLESIALDSTPLALNAA
ncbi:MAG: XrtA system polysaccharide deacetylase [Pseudomonadota bacterium]